MQCCSLRAAVCRARTSTDTALQPAFSTGAYALRNVCCPQGLAVEVAPGRRRSCDLPDSGARRGAGAGGRRAAGLGRARGRGRAHQRDRHPERRHLRHHQPQGRQAAFPLGEPAPHPDARQRHRAPVAVQERRPGFSARARGDGTPAARQPLHPRRAVPAAGLARRCRRHRGHNARHLDAGPRRQRGPRGRRRPFRQRVRVLQRPRLRHRRCAALRPRLEQRRRQRRDFGATTLPLARHAVDRRAHCVERRPHRRPLRAGWLRKAGFGLRIVSARAAFSNVLHIDLAFPLGAPADIKKVQFLVKTNTSF